MHTFVWSLAFLLACAQPPAAAPPQPATAADAAQPETAEASQEAAPAEPPEPAPAPPAPPRPRAIWVLAEGSQRALEHPDRLASLLEDIDALEITDVFVQVYRGGRSWFASDLADPAPYQRVFRSGAAGEPARDALDVLLDEASARGVRVHAWVNVLSLAKNPDAPIVHALGRDVVLSDQWGRSLLDYPGYEPPAPHGDHYRMGTPGVFLDPAFPGLAERLAATFEELLVRYPGFAGLHFDYIRYPGVLPFSPGLRFGKGISLGHGAATRARFAAETGLAAPFGDSIENGNCFDDWRREKLTDLVARIGNRARVARPGLEISAAVISYADRAYLSLFQDWRGWLEEGLIDVAVPMLYSKDPRIVRYGTEHFAGLPYAERIWVGLGTWLFASDPGRALAQLGEVDSRPPLGVAMFSWDSIRENDALLHALAAGEVPAEPEPAVPSVAEAPAPAPAAPAPETPDRTSKEPTPEDIPAPPVPAPPPETPDRTSKEPTPEDIPAPPVPAPPPETPDRTSKEPTPEDIPAPPVPAPPPETRPGPPEAPGPAPTPPEPERGAAAP